MNRISASLALVASVLLFGSAQADEGMWLLNDFPKDRLKEKHGFAATDPWLEQVRSASVRIAQGCSGSFVSERGLVLTNHHCARGCIQQLSTKDHNLAAAGFYAKAEADELRCPALEVNQLVGIEDVTSRIQEKTAGLADREANEVRKAEMSRIEGECATEAKLRCDVVRLFHGGRYHLYKYRRHQDVRLVFAPEEAIAFFGGDPDNFMFPRYDLDMAFLRVYEGGAPAKTPAFFKWSRASLKDGDLVFVTGHPGRTGRLSTGAQLEHARDDSLPTALKYLAELRGLLHQFGKQGPEQLRISRNDFFGVENAFKALNGRHQTLLDKGFWVRKVAAEQALRAKVAANPELQKQYGEAWDQVAQAIDRWRGQGVRHRMIEGAGRMGSRLFSMARTLVRAAEERPKPQEKRFREFRDAAMPFLTHMLFSRAPIYPELEELKLELWLARLREQLGPDDPFVRKVLGRDSPAEVARALVSGSKLARIGLRKELWLGGQKAIEASDDVLIQLVRKIDGDARAVRKKYEDEVEAPLRKNGELVAKATFAAYGTSLYPDATFSLRISYGTVRGWAEGGTTVAPVTFMRGAFERATGKDPFALPGTWLAAKDKLHLDTPMNFVSDNDIIGGNSGSPAINREGELAGLVFDGNIHSLGGDYWFDEAKNRTVAVDAAAIVEALRVIYRADRLLGEILPAK